jgi:hypothetical protein
MSITIFEDVNSGDLQTHQNVKKRSASAFFYKMRTC